MVRRDAVEGAPVAEERIVVPEDPPQVFVFDPRGAALRENIRTFVDAMEKWRDRQAHGRLSYEMMMRHPSASAPFKQLVSFLISSDGAYSPAVADPTAKQQEMSDFLNSQVRRVSWPKLVDGFFGAGLEFGFSLAEFEVRRLRWRGRNMRQLVAIRPLPQASLDGGEMPREEYGEMAATDPRYKCFDIGDDGGVVAVYQYRDTSMVFGGPEDELRRPGTIVWKGGNLNRILHYKHGGGDGNPFGESLLYSAFYPWSDLWLAERLEMAFFEANSMPYLTVSYDSDMPKPALHDQVKRMVGEAATHRLLMLNRAVYGSVSPSNPDFVDHADKIKRRLEGQITQAILVPSAVFRESEEREQSIREVIQIFVKFRLPAVLREIEDVMTDQLGKRLIDTNYSNAEAEDYPRFRFRLRLNDDIKNQMPLLQQLVRYIDAEKIGEFAESMTGMQREWFPNEHHDSVDVKRPTDKTDEKPDSKGAGKQPDRTGDRRGTEGA